MSTNRSAVSRASKPGMFELKFGLIVPSFGSIANSTVQSNPCRSERIRASCGIACSERYSSSPLTSTTRLPLPGPCFPSRISRSSAANAPVSSAKQRIDARIIERYDNRPCRELLHRQSGDDQSQRQNRHGNPQRGASANPGHNRKDQSNDGEDDADRHEHTSACDYTGPALLRQAARRGNCVGWRIAGQYSSRNLTLPPDRSHALKLSPRTVLAGANVSHARQSIPRPELLAPSRRPKHRALS